MSVDHSLGVCTSTCEDSSTRLYSSSTSAAYSASETCRRGVPFAVNWNGLLGLVTVIIWVREYPSVYSPIHSTKGASAYLLEDTRVRGRKVVRAFNRRPAYNQWFNTLVLT